ncbi:MAG: hypothetical protein KKI12_10650 [Proteobacteria bacterium]|nr:hypothetical protein [Pseudomonadota bacterium]MBU4288615.1 hypothetical protein [Pseudomonadota bacterium]MCG2759573.1 hypothetical protein [Desulfobacteraceae bacterium]
MSNFNANDSKVRCGIYLCQVNEEISCGACCGLYNVVNPSYESIMEMLTWRTDTFSHVKREMDAILAFKEEVEDREPQERPFPDFHHCPYIGLVGKEHSRVGCLLHPLFDENKSIDFRGLSFYGGMACRVYFCPTYNNLPAVFKEIVRETASNWYAYGLVITEAKLLNTIFEEVAKRLNRPLTANSLLKNNGCLETVRELLDLKINWPFRRKTSSGPANYFFEDQLYSRPSINYEAIGGSVSRHDILLQELESQFNSANELHAAEDLIDGLINKVIGQVDRLKTEG